ncbi:hypothetical protein TcasGA2_TC032371 [Tribolium castaneum]|uniref:Uncharacterized protein n=1 Tax=Tribolium castaneum TaxID=7070 RepID=A0A139WL49_TRICA|nr:hypothetical protein TcasGA2_TC032371 [Tribolium castaneum]
MCLLIERRQQTYTHDVYRRLTITCCTANVPASPHSAVYSVPGNVCLLLIN